MGNWPSVAGSFGAFIQSVTDCATVRRVLWKLIYKFADFPLSTSVKLVLVKEVQISAGRHPVNVILINSIIAISYCTTSLQERLAPRRVFSTFGIALR